MNQHSPKSARLLLEFILPEHLIEPVLGDLEEEFNHRATSQTLLKRQLWYWRQALTTTFHFINHTQKALIMFLISVVFFGSLTFLAMYLGGGVGAFMDLPSFIITLPPALLFTLAVTSKASFGQAFNIVLSGHADSLKQVRTSLMVFSVLGNTSLWIGALMTVVGWIAIGSQLTDIEVFGRAFAISILTMFYALVIKLICYVACQRITYIGESLSPAE